MTSIAAAPEGEAIAAVQRILSIYSAADGRELTARQASDLKERQEDVRRALRADGLDSNQYNLLAAMAESDVDAGKADNAETAYRALESTLTARAKVRRTDGLHRAIKTGITERGSFGEPEVRAQISDLIREYRQHGYANADIYLSPGFQTRALQSAGGSAVPVTFYDQLTIYQRTATPMLNDNIVTIDSRDSGAGVTFSRLTADPNAGGTVTAEAAGITEADATVSAVTGTPYKYAITTLWSAELDQDNAIGLEEAVARTSARAISRGAGAHLTTGDGSAKPYGFITRATNGGTAGGTALATAADTYFSWLDLIDLKYSLAAPYRANGTFMVSTTAMAKIRKFRASTNEPLFDIGADGIPRFDGSPVVENPDMAAVGSATKSVSFGDFSAYHVVRVFPLRVELSRDYKFNTDQVAIRVVDRLTGDLIDTAAVAYQVCANS